MGSREIISIENRLYLVPLGQIQPHPSPFYYTPPHSTSPQPHTLHAFPTGILIKPSAQHLSCGRDYFTTSCGNIHDSVYRCADFYSNFTPITPPCRQLWSQSVPVCPSWPLDVRCGPCQDRCRHRRGPASEAPRQRRRRRRWTSARDAHIQEAVNVIRRAIADNSGGYLGPAGPGGGAPCDVMFSWAVLRGTASNGDAGRAGFRRGPWTAAWTCFSESGGRDTRCRWEQNPGCITAV